MANKVETILEEIKGLTLLEAADLVKKMEETFGVSAAAAINGSLDPPLVAPPRPEPGNPPKSPVSVGSCCVPGSPGP